MPSINRPKRQRRDERRSERMKIYNSSRWRELRRIKLISCPICERCEQRGLSVPAEDIHHKNSFMNHYGGDRLYVAYDYDNLESLCKECHSKEHNEKNI